MVIILQEQNFNINSFCCDMEQQQQQQQQDRQLRELHVEEGIQLHQHEDYHHHHLQEEETQLQRSAGLYWKMTGGLVLTSGLFFGSCVFW